MRTLRYGLLAGGVALGLACQGCPPTPLTPPPRGATPHDHALPINPAPSVIQVQALLPPEDLQALVEEALPQALLQASAHPLVGDVVADIDAIRQGEARLTLREDRLRIDVPVEVKAKVYRRQRDGGRGASLGQGQARLILQVGLGLRLRSDWTLVPQDTEVRYRWTDPPLLRIGRLRLDLGTALDARLDARLPELKAQIEQKIRATDLLAARAAAAWEALHVPRALRHAPAAPLWLHFAPTRLFAADPAISERGMALVLGAAGDLAVRTQRPPDAVERGAPPLPPRTLPPEGAAEARLHIPLEVGWPLLLAQARTRLEGEILTAMLPAGAGPVTATITEVTDLYPSGEDLAVGLRLTGTVAATGTILQAEAWLQGRPVLDVDTQHIHLEDFDYIAATDRRAANVALDALQPTLQAAVAEQLSFPLDEVLQPLRVDLNAQLNGMTLENGATLSGEISSLRLQAVHLRDEALIIEVDVSAALVVTLGP